MSNKSRGQSAGGERRIVLFSTTKEVRLQPTFEGSYCSRSFDSGGDFIPYLKPWFHVKIKLF